MFMNTTPRETADSYNIIGPGVTELSISYNPQTSTNQYIHEDVANTDMTGYQPNAPVSGQAVPGDPVFDFVNEMRKKLSLGSSPAALTRRRSSPYPSRLTAMAAPLPTRFPLAIQSTGAEAASMARLTRTPRPLQRGAVNKWLAFV